MWNTWQSFHNKVEVLIRELVNGMVVTRDRIILSRERVSYINFWSMAHLVTIRTVPIQRARIAAEVTCSEARKIKSKEAFVRLGY
jgi:hypothetical protein